VIHSRAATERRLRIFENPKRRKPTAEVSRLRNRKKIPINTFSNVSAVRICKQPGPRGFGVSGNFFDREPEKERLIGIEGL
jgi:hypothetical protein